MRVVAGAFKGRKLAGPPGNAVRPTSDKVREALFSILGAVDGLRVLDLFAGTGALGIEALSRGALSAEFVDSDRKALDTVRRNLGATLGEDQSPVTVIRADALRFLDAADGDAYELIFVDPPYRDAATLAPSLAAKLPRVLAGGGTVVAECDRRAPLLLEELSQNALALVSERKYGDTLIRIFSRSDAGG
ncbi:MAG: 16S rRNA (guanine(966)-N(2))-methyltransferase RsmD [Solirubrobacterales bacterium]